MSDFTVTILFRGCKESFVSQERAESRIAAEFQARQHAREFGFSFPVKKISSRPGF